MPLRRGASKLFDAAFEASSPRPPRAGTWPLAAPALVLALSAAITLLAWHLSSRQASETARLRFEREVAGVEQAIDDRMRLYENSLRGAQGLFAASKRVERGEWRRYVEKIDLQGRYPGIQGLGFSLRVAPRELEKHVRSVRAEGFSGYTVHPAFNRPVYHSIVFLEPFDQRNQRAFGYDMFTEPTRRAAMEQARDTGLPAVSGRVTLLQETKDDLQPGFLMYLPVYRTIGVPDKLEARRAALVGFVYAPFRTNDLMRSALGKLSPEVGLRVFDGKQAHAEALLYERAFREAGARFASTRMIEFGGRPWTLQFASLPALDASVGRGEPVLVLLGGLAMSLLLAGMTWVLVSARGRAIALARAMVEELREGREEYRVVTETAHDAIVSADSRGNIMHFNPAAERMFGYRAAEAIGRPLTLLIPERFHEPHRQGMQRFLASGESRVLGQTLELYARRREGTEFPIELSIAHWRTARETFFTAFLRDITSRRQSEQALKQLNEELEHRVQKRTEELAAAFNELQRFRLALDSSVDMVLILDRATMRHVDVNQTACRLLGYSREELLRMTPQDILPVSNEELAKAYDALIADPSQASAMTSYYRCKDGSHLPFESTRHVLRSGDAWLIAVIARDIRERMAAEQALRESEAGLRHAQEVARLAHVVTGPDGSYQAWSESVSTLLGLAPEKLPKTTRESMLLIHEEDRERFRQASIEGARRGTRVEVEYRVRRADGEWLHIRHVAEPSTDSDGRTRWFNIFQDVSSQKQAAEAVQASETRFRSIFENAAVGILNALPGGRVINANPEMARMLGYASPGELIEQVTDMARQVYVDAADRERVLERVRAEGIARNVELRLRRKDGSEIWVSLSACDVRNEATGESYLLGMVQDITRRREQQRRIERLTRVYAVLSGINTLLIRVSSREELYREACRIAVEEGKFPMVWIGEVEREAKRVNVVASQGTDEDFLAEIPMSIEENGPRTVGVVGRAVLGAEPVVANDIEHDDRVIAKGSMKRGARSLVVLALVTGGEVVGVLTLYSDVLGFFDEAEMKLLRELAGDISFAIEHIAKSERLNYLAYYDELTGLPNRTLFHERLEQLVAGAGRKREDLALIVTDIERFKAINDALGRHAGDQLLRELAVRMREAMPEPYGLARLSADHYAVAAPNVGSPENAARMVQEIGASVLSAPFELAGQEVRVTMKAGISLYPADGMDADTLFRNAEAALKKAKASGDRFLFYTEEMTARTGERLALEGRLRGAIEREEFVLHYQPKVDLEDRRVVGVEALIRWNDPERGLVPPGHFIPLLEETRMILQVGAWALSRAVLDHRHWVRMGIAAPRIAVNVSQVQLRQADFVEILKEAVAQGVKPTGLDLEVTESLLMEDVEGNIRKFTALRELGVDIAIDDFGTGYSSLSYLSRLPVQALKIDRSFVHRMLEEPNAMTLVQTMISLAHSLRLKVVAEGVETEEQARILRLLRCDEMQGYLVSKPVPMEELTPLLRGEPR